MLQGCHDWPLSRVIEVRYPEVYSVSDKVPGYHPPELTAKPYSPGLRGYTGSRVF